MKRHLLIIMLLLLQSLILFIPMYTVVADGEGGGNIDGETVYWENEYANLSVYPHTSDGLITHTQYANLTWKAGDNVIDVAFRFNDTVTGHIWRWDGALWQDVAMEHTTYNDKEYYFYAGFNVVQDTTYRFRWMYNTTANTNGKWDLMAKLNSESIAEALASGHYVMLDPWWGTGFEKRVGIVVNGDQIWGDDTITNFPLLVNLSTVANINADTQAGGWDLRFVNQANDTQYNYHFADDWDIYNKVWVQIPALTPHEDFYFNCYYGKASATRSSNYSADDVWSSNYLAVYYMNSTLDMSGNGYDFTTNNGVTFTNATDSSIGKCAWFDGVADYLVIDNDALDSAFLNSGGFLCGVQWSDGTDAYVFDYVSGGDKSRNYITTIKVFNSLGEDDGNPVWSPSHSNMDSGRIDLISLQTSTNKVYQWGDGYGDDEWGQNISITSYPTATAGVIAIGCKSDVLGTNPLYGYMDTLIILDNPVTDNEMHLWGYNFRGMGLVNFSSVTTTQGLGVTNTSTDVTDTTLIANGFLSIDGGVDMTAGFWIGTTTPITEGNADQNVTAGTSYREGDEYSYNVTGLTEGELYYITTWVGSSLTFASSNEIETFTHPANATNLLTSSLENGIRLDWTHGNGYDASILLVNDTGIGAYPTHPDDPNGIEIYNGSNTFYEYVDLQPACSYYFSLWEYASEGSHSDHSLSYITTFVLFQDYTIYCNDTTLITTSTATLNGAFTGSSLHGDYDYGFWYGTTTPLNQGTFDTNITVGIGGEGISYTLDLSSLDDGETYYARSWISNNTFWLTSTEESFITIPLDPSALTLTINGTDNLNLTWTKNSVTDAVTAVVVRQKDSYPEDWTEGTIVYNGTNAYFDDVGGKAGTHWYYRIWNHKNPFSDSYAEADVMIPPAPPYNVNSEVLSNSTFHIDWTKGTGANTTVVVKKENTFPSSPTDGTLINNDTGTEVFDEDVSFGASMFYSLWSYANGTYSSKVDVSQGGIVINCFSEEGEAPLRFDVFISNEEGTETYEALNQTNPLIINTTETPHGDKCSIRISSASYLDNRSESFTYSNDENETITYVILELPPSSKRTTNVSCINTSSGAHFYPAFTVVDDTITILADACPQFDKITVDYIYSEYRERTYYLSLYNNTLYLLEAYLPPTDGSNLYQMTVIDEFNQPLHNAYMTFKRYIGDEFKTVSTLFTSAQGTTELYLMDNEIYKIIITKSGYQTEIADVVTDTEIRSHTFKLLFDGTIPDTEYSIFHNMTFTIEPDVYQHNPYQNLFFNISSSDNLIEWMSASIYYYNRSLDANNVTIGWELIYSENITDSPSGGSIHYNISNATGQYKFVCAFKKIGFQMYVTIQEFWLYRNVIERVEDIPSEMWLIITIVIMLVVMGFLAKFGAGAMIGVGGIIVMGIMFSLKPAMVIGGISAWWLLLSTTVVYIILIYLMRGR